MFGFLKKDKESIVYSPCSGRVIPIEEVRDEVFSQKMMGDGVGVIATEECLYAPFDGEIIQVFDTKHAILLNDKSNNTLLIHIGIDTVKLNGEPFEVKVQPGDFVKKGDMICKVDFDFIKSKNLDPTVIVLLMDEVGEKKIKEKNIVESITNNNKLFKI